MGHWISSDGFNCRSLASAVNKSLPALTFAEHANNGIVYMHYNNRTHTGLLISLTLVTIGVFIMPYMPSFGALLTLAVIQGLGFGCLELLGNILLIRLHKEEVGPYRQALSFCFGFGAFLGPLLAEPFLGNSSPSHASPTLHWAFLVASLALIPGVLLAMFDVYILEWQTATYTPVTQQQQQHQQSLININNNNSNGTNGVVSSDTYTGDDTTSSSSTSSTATSPVATNDEVKGAPKPKRPVTSQRFQLVTLSLVSIFLFCYVGSELGFGTFLHTYVHEGNHFFYCL
jgi:fucose permease